MKLITTNFAFLGLVLTLSLSLSSCGNSDDDERSAAPTVSIISPKDTLILSDKVTVELLFNDNSGLVSTEITLGNADQGNLVYHYSQRGLNGLSDDLSFEAEIPSVVDATGNNYIIIEVLDEDGNETFVEGKFYFLPEDSQDPTISNIIHQGVLTRDPQSSMSLAYSLSDNQALDSLYLMFLETSNGNFTGDTIWHRGLALNGQKEVQGLEYIPGSLNYFSGANYRVYAKAIDQVGNSKTYISPNEYTVGN